MSEEKKKSYSGEKESGFKGGKGAGGRKFGQGKSTGRSGGFGGGKPAWKKDGEGRKGGKPAWKKDGEGKGESKDGKRFGDKPAWKKSGKPGFDKRRDDRGDKPAWKKDGEKRFSRSDDKRRDGFRKDSEQPFEKKRNYVKVDESGENRTSFKKPAANRDQRNDEARREKRGDRYLRDNARLKSKKERDAAELAREDDFVYAGDHQLSKKAQEGIFVEIGETVAHENYGVGTVRKVTNGKVAVVFDGKYRWFAFPSSLENGVLRQVDAESVVEEQETPAEAEEGVEQEEAVSGEE